MITTQKMPSGCSALMHAAYMDGVALSGMETCLLDAKALLRSWDTHFQRTQIETANDEEDKTPLEKRIEAGRLSDLYAG